MEVLSGLIVVIGFLMLVAIAAGWCGEKYENRSKSSKTYLWDDEIKNKEESFLTQQQKNIISHIEGLSDKDRIKFLYGDYKKSVNDREVECTLDMTGKSR